MIVNGVDSSLAVKSFTVYGTRDIKSVSQTGLIAFAADTVLSRKQIDGINQISIASTTVTSPEKLFTGIKVGDILRYQTSSGDESFNRVDTIAGNLQSFTLKSSNQCFWSF